MTKNEELKEALEKILPGKSCFLAFENEDAQTEVLFRGETEEILALILGVLETMPEMHTQLSAYIGMRGNSASGLMN